MLNILRNMWIISSLILLLINFEVRQINAYECGRTDYIQPQTLNGFVSDRGAWPFLAALFLVENYQFFCGSTVISAKHVLTAAHCVHPKSSTERDPEDVIVILGAYNIDIRIERGVQQRNVDNITVHPDWDPLSEKYDADLGILVLSQTVEFTKYIRPVCVPESDPPVDVLGSIVGWGLSERTTAYSRHESVPLQANIRILKDSYCYTTYHFLAFRSTPRLFCGGDGGSPSKGDSGGGLFVRSGSSWIQYGIISVMSSDSNGNTISDVFSLYTNLKEFRSWIDKAVEESGSSVMTAAKKREIDLDLIKLIRTDLLSKLCSVWDVNVTNDNFEVHSFTGQHLTGYDHQTVLGIWFRNHTVEYIPHGIGKKFTGLRTLYVGSMDKNVGLKRLQRANFENMENLYYISVVNNDIEIVDEDSLRDLPILTTFFISLNKLKRLGRDTFEKNTKLQEFHADYNQLEYLHRDSFKNNEELMVVNLRDNNLKLIYVDFTRCDSILVVDVRANACIDRMLDTHNNNKTEFQSFINHQCTSSRR